MNECDQACNTLDLIHSTYRLRYEAAEHVTFAPALQQ